jgi:hypothetical protein
VVAIPNNGVNKGGGAAYVSSRFTTSRVSDVWQLHASSNAGADNFPEPFIANLDDAKSYWIKLEAQPDGSFRIYNARTAKWKTYPPRDAAPVE